MSSEATSPVSRRHRWFQFRLASLLLAVTVIAVWLGLRLRDPVRLEIDKLYDPANHVKCGAAITPGGELLVFSEPMLNLIAMGERARHPVERRIDDLRIQNEVAVILGAIGDESTVPLLIATYPEIATQNPDFAFADDPDVLKVVCFTHALTYLTGEPIGRTRLGADLNPQNKRLWSAWWQAQRTTFRVPSTKPKATWVPEYPTINATRCADG